MKVDRIFGADRYSTSIKIAKSVYSNANKFLTTQMLYQLHIGLKNKSPIILSKKRLFLKRLFIYYKTLTFTTIFTLGIPAPNTLPVLSPGT
ncbi:cell wall-binding repeat-containing protein [Miniphocaeibacter massiliensis]|uniref:cell wall-binding repeat-containing protein n=1 Tax=Miniphocaeibacter massiliensis TaxID=2041841 RepID=UPI003BF55EAA